MLFIFFLFIILFNVLNTYRNREGYLGFDSNLIINGGVPFIIGPFDAGGIGTFSSEFHNFGGRPITNFDIFGNNGEVEQEEGETVISGDKDIREQDIREQDIYLPNEDGSVNYEWLCDNLDYPLGKKNHYTLMEKDSDKYTPEYFSKNATYCKMIKKKKLDDEGSKKSASIMKTQAEGNKDKTNEQKNKLENAKNKISNSAGLTSSNIQSLPATRVK